MPNIRTRKDGSKYPVQSKAKSQRTIKETKRSHRSSFPLSERRARAKDVLEDIALDLIARLKIPHDIVKKYDYDYDAAAIEFRETFKDPEKRKEVLEKYEIKITDDMGRYDGDAGQMGLLVDGDFLDVFNEASGTLGGMFSTETYERLHKELDNLECIFFMTTHPCWYEVYCMNDAEIERERQVQEQLTRNSEESDKHFPRIMALQAKEVIPPQEHDELEWRREESRKLMIEREELYKQEMQTILHNRVRKRFEEGHKRTPELYAYHSETD